MSWSTSELRVRLAPLNRFKPSSKIFYWPFQGGTSFVDPLCFCSVLCLLCFVRVSLYVLRGHLLGKGWPLGSRLWCLLWVCHFPIGILGQVWYLIVSIPDLCNLTYFKNGIILSICISWNNCFMFRTWKQLFLICAKSPHSKRMWRTVNGASQPTQCGCSSPCSKYEWVTLVWLKRSRAKTTSSFLMFQTTDWCSPIVGFISRSLFPMLLFHEMCHWSKLYLLIDGLKFENGI